MYAVNEIKLVNYTKQLGGIIPYFARLLHECINDFFPFVYLHGCILIIPFAYG
jgi:hypothetical protein